MAEVEVDLIEDATGWSPYLSVSDAEKLDQVRLALKADDTLAETRQRARIERAGRGGARGPGRRRAGAGGAVR